MKGLDASVCDGHVYSAQTLLDRGWVCIGDTWQDPKTDAWMTRYDAEATELRRRQLWRI